MKFQNQLFIKMILFLFCTTIYAQQTPKAPRSTNNNSNSVETSNTSNSNVNETITYVNNLLDKYNKYNSYIEVDISRGEITFIDKFSILTAKFTDIEYYNTNNNIGFKCKDGTSCINQKDSNTKNILSPKTSYSFSIKRDEEKMIYETNVVISKLNDMLTELTGSFNNNNNNSAIVNRNLIIINDAFQKYNTYNAKFRVIDTRLYLDNSVSNFSADLNDVIFYVNYKSKWIVLKCIEEGCFEGTTFKDEYSMSLKTESGSISPEMHDVLNAFNIIRKEILSK